MTHEHDWKTKISGMICDCGASLSQDEVEDIVNKHLGTFNEEGLVSVRPFVPSYNSTDSGKSSSTINIEPLKIGLNERERITEIILEAFE